MALPSCNIPRVRLESSLQKRCELPQQPGRSRTRVRTPSLLATTLTAALLAACGGGDGNPDSAATGADSGDMSQFESVISADPRVRQMVLAKALSPKAESDEEAGRDGGSDGDGSGDGDESGSGDETGDHRNRDSDETSAEAASDLIETLVGDMRKMNDHPLRNVNRKYGWARGPGYVQAGVDSNGWNYVLPWFVTLEGEGNSARNTRIEMRNLRMFILTDNGEWKRLIDVDSYAGIECEQHGNYYQCPQTARVREGDTSASSMPIPGLNMHGWWDSRVRIDGHHIVAIIVSLEPRLIVDDEARGDDRDEAKYLVNVGADYYPSDAPPSGRLIPVGVSRAKMVTNEWQTFALTTLNDVGRQEPGGGISEAELRANPPPY